MEKLTGRSLMLDESHINYAKDNFLNLSELVRYLLDNYEQYKKWRDENGK